MSEREMARREKQRQNSNSALSLEEFLTRREVERAVGKKRSWIYLRVKEKRFPPPVHDGKSVRWLRSDIERYQQRLIEQRDAA